MKMSFRVLAIAAAGIAFLALSARVEAQTGRVSGAVVDEEGNPVGEVEIVIAPVEEGSVRPRQMKTKDDGKFLLGGLRPGRYTMTYQKEGYEPLTQNVRVQIGEINRLEEVVLFKRPETYIDPSAQDHFNSAVAAAEGGNYQAAVDSFLKVLVLAPDVPQVHYNIALAYENLDDMAKAQEHYERAVELKPDHFDSLISLAGIRTAQSDWATAAEYLSQALAIDPTDVTAQYNYGAVSMNQGEMDAAQAAFEKVLELDPTQALAHFQLGMIAVGQARNEDAVTELQKYLELDPQGAQAATAQSIIDTLTKQ